MIARLSLMMWLAALPALAGPKPLFSREAAARLVGQVMADPTVVGRLQHLTDAIGPRLSGSEGDKRAVAWTAEQFRADGLSVTLEAVKVPHWVRGEETGEVLAAAGRTRHPLSLTALGGSAPTAAEGVEGDVLMVRSIGELEGLGDKARGRVVFFQHGMSTSRGYGIAGNLRTRGPAAASQAGAIAALVRSAASASLRTPHTGATRFTEPIKAIPAAAIATEDADLLERLLGSGPVRVRLRLGCKTLPDADSANVVAELRGREKPEQIVLASAHLDSWDLGTGAIDDGAGVAMVMGAMRALAALPQKPRRTIRAVLFANEENGLRGGKDYEQRHAAELPRHVAALEMDAGQNRVLSVSGPGAPALLGPWLGRGGPLAGLGVTEVTDANSGGADIDGLGKAGVPLVALRQETSRYFEVHHSAADTFDKIDPHQLRQATAALAWVLFALAEMEGTLDRRVTKEAEH